MFIPVPEKRHERAPAELAFTKACESSCGSSEERAVCEIGDITALDSWVGSWGKDRDTAHASARSRPWCPLAMGLFLRPAEIFTLLLGSKRRSTYLPYFQHVPIGRNIS